MTSEAATRMALRSNLKYSNYLKTALMGAEVVRPSGTYIGHDASGNLKNSIRDYWFIKASRGRQVKVEFRERMLEYGYKLSEGYRAEPVDYNTLFAWAQSRGADHVGAIYRALRKRPLRQGSGWIQEARDDFFPAIQNKISMNMDKAVNVATDAYLTENLTKIFKL
jgi:hypothetical protein